MSRIDEFIKDLPERLQPIARRWATTLLSRGEKYVRVWLEGALKGNKRKAFRDLAVSLTTKELLEEMDASIERFKEGNNDNASLDDVQGEVVDTLIDIFVKWLVSLALN